MSTRSSWWAVFLISWVLSLSFNYLSFLLTALCPPCLPSAWQVGLQSSGLQLPLEQQYLICGFPWPRVLIWQSTLRSDLFLPRCLYNVLKYLYWASAFPYQLGWIQEWCFPDLFKAVRYTISRLRPECLWNIHLWSKCAVLVIWPVIQGPYFESGFSIYVFYFLLLCLIFI